ATVFGMVPMALGLGEGAETNMPLARAVIGGLVVSTALTLLVIPLIYVLFEEHFPRRRRPAGS
ncbi:MAG TPA: efflux RND transporter permease subunit, partial [bacterium]|nr:efflux RND transporter permease subunit [bacterium]HXX36655.1 efflux RND transporter permease subunit [bacterium]